jgi:cysteinyl-tRNA synthetase
MALDLLDDDFDLHGGGNDLAFPHHENERAQAVAEGRTFANHWTHNGFVEIGGEKMSKSLGNFTNLLDLIDATDPRAFRLLVLQSHYRSPIEVNQTNAEAAATSLRKLDEFSRRAAELPEGEPDEAVLDEFRRLMDHDLNTPGAVDLLFTLVKRGNKALAIDDDTDAATAAATVHQICTAVGLELEGADLRPIPDDMLALAAERDVARRDRDWGRSDALRQQLQERGYIVEDGPAGTQLRRRP